MIALTSALFTVPSPFTSPAGEALNRPYGSYRIRSPGVSCVNPMPITLKLRSVSAYCSVAKVGLVFSVPFAYSAAAVSCIKHTSSSMYRSPHTNWRVFERLNDADAAGNDQFPRVPLLVRISSRRHDAS